MDVDGGGRLMSPATEEETVARRRSRRVSFADTTAVRVFDRDEDFETAPEERSASPSPGRSSSVEREREDGDDTEEEFLRPPVFFPREVDSSSPGSGAGSVASTDDENFFGPVSASFIQTGRPSDSGISEDDNHDITLDSRTFSLHFRNIDPPDDCTANSAGSLRTPNTAPKGPLEELNVSEPGRKSSSGRDALTDMSLLTGNPRTYDYGKLSPTLNNVIQKIKVEQRKSPKAAVADVNPNRVLTLAASENEHREENSCIGNSISSDELGTVHIAEESISVRNPVSISTDPIQEDNVMIIDGHEKSKENCKHDHMVVYPGVNNAVEPPVLLSTPYKSFTSNVDLQPPLLYQSLSKDQPSGSNGTTSASSMSNVDLKPPLLDQPLSKDQPPGTNHITKASQLSSAAPAFSLKDAEQLHQQNEVMDTEIIVHTLRTVGQPLQFPQGSISSLRSKRQKLFSPNPLSNSKVASQEACSLGSEFVEHGKRISALENVLKIRRLQESPAASRLPLVKRNELDLQTNDIFSNAEDHDSILFVSSNSVPQRQLKKTGESFILGIPPRQGLNEATKVLDTSCDVLTLDSQPSHECNSLLDLDGGGKKRSAKENGRAVQERPEETAKAARSPRKSRKQLTCVSQSSYIGEERQNDAHDNGQLVNVDWNKVVCIISNATEQVFSASISKLNLEQLDMLGDKLDEIQMARKYKRLSTAVRIRIFCGDQQKRLAEAISLHDKLLYEKAKLQINNMKLAKIRNKAQLCQVGIQECRSLKSKISGAAQMKDASLHAATLINANDRQEGLAIVTKKRLELNSIHQKVQNLRSSLECFLSIKGDISCDSVMRSAEEQLEMRKQCCVIHQQAGLWELNDAVKRDSKRDVILNYRNLLFQRIILNISDRSSIFVNNSLNGTKIGQTFPNLDASVAFNFVFKAEENHRVSDLRSLQKKTTETSLLLGQLALRLCFMNFKSGKRIAFTIDMSDLNRSVYPSEPSELLIKVCEAQTTLAQPSIYKTMVSIRNLQPGRTMILRLCRMVSQLIHSLPG
ncbi:uncharacterized protein LOC133927006 isoform X2 [Phragmites australis]|uniref:uncharacterized protein LOC133927006 isoform X2 n=1 Tax=Phragmites australis TaxID=29695 RepID=UPI002D7A3666|nr:uncharacterized protein LOC133927006 isoform X2 [Phragmites australis]